MLISYSVVNVINSFRCILFEKKYSFGLGFWCNLWIILIFVLGISLSSVNVVAQVIAQSIVQSQLKSVMTTFEDKTSDKASDRTSNKTSDKRFDKVKLHESFKSWLIRNENKTLEIISNDRKIINMFTMINPILINPKPVIPKPQNKILALNAKIYKYLDEINDINFLVSTYGNSNLANVFSNILPGNWACMSIIGVYTFYVSSISNIINDICLKLYFQVLEIDIDRDKDIIQRFDKANKLLTSNDKRFLQNYFEIFNALYPKNNDIKVLQAFILNGINPEVKKTLYEICSVRIGKISGAAAKVLEDITKILAESTSTVNIRGSELSRQESIDIDKLPSENEVGIGYSGQDKSNISDIATTSQYKEDQNTVSKNEVQQEKEYKEKDIFTIFDE